MTAFTSAEVAFLTGIRLGHLATLNPDGSPHVVPARFTFNQETDTIDVGGFNMANSKKWRDAGRDPRVAFVIDDIGAPTGKGPQGVEVRGTAVLLHDQEIIRITPTRIVSWGIDTEPLKPNSRAVHRPVQESDCDD